MKEEETWRDVIKGPILSQSCALGNVIFLYSISTAREITFIEIRFGQGGVVVPFGDV
jgi:hypothetical protein